MSAIKLIDGRGGFHANAKPHDGCPNPAACNCDCAGCNRAWERAEHSASPPSPAADPPEPDAMRARARALLRHLDHEQWRAEESYTNARKEAAESAVCRRERMHRITTGNHAEAVKELASLKIYQGMPELAKRDEGVDARWEQTLSEHRFRLVRAVAEYEGAHRVAVEVGLIEPDEYPRWARPKSK